MNKAQKDAIELLRGLSKEEILEEFESMKLNKNVIKEGECFYYNDEEGGINKFEYIKRDDDWYNLLFSKCYYNPNEQLKQLRYDTLRMKIVSRIRELNNGWIPDFSNHDMEKYWIRFDHEDKIVEYDLSYCIQYLPSDMYLKSITLAKQLIREMSDELIEYFNYQNWNWLEVDNDSV